jgi:hypothetical protein
MGQTRFNIKNNGSICACPKCLNDKEFICKSRQVAEDCCEVWVECKCGFDPTFGNGMKRLEDVWGERGRGQIVTCLDIWSDEIKELETTACAD